MRTKERQVIVSSMNISDAGFYFNMEIASELETAKLDLADIEERIFENTETIAGLTPECDKWDYILAASSGAICGLIDIFLVNSPGDFKLGEMTDGFYDKAIVLFAKLCGWKSKTGNGDDVKSAIGFLEKMFKVPYDQTSVSKDARSVFNLSTRDHHYKSLGHNPNLVGLVFSIVDQFSNSSHFVSNGELFDLAGLDGGFELRGNSVPAKLWAAVVNWFGHLISDVGGSSGCKGRGMGLPAPFMNWVNDIIALKAKLNIPSSEFEKNLNKIAMDIYKEGFDARFATAQVIPVLINELLTRLCFSVRRLFLYFKDTPESERSFPLMWKTCKPYSNVTVKRMLTVAHGTFCLFDLSGAAVKGIMTGNGVEFIMSLNISGCKRFAISLFGECHRGISRHNIKVTNELLKQDRELLKVYIEGLSILSEYYSDEMFLAFVSDLKNSMAYKQAFEKTVQLADKRGVPDKKILRTKEDIDRYFNNSGEESGE